MASSANYQAWVEVVPEFKGFNKEVNKNVTDKLGEAGDRGGSKLGRNLGLKVVSGLALAVGGIAVAGVGALAGTALSKGLSRSLDIQDATKKLEGLKLSVGDIETVSQNALASVKGTAFGLGEAMGLAGVLVASGIKPGEQLQATLTRVADSAAIAGTDLNDMGQIFGKVAAKGRLDGEILNQLLERQIPIFDILGKKYGKNTEEIQKMVSEGKVSFQDFSDAMNEYVGGAAQKTGETARGAFANLQAGLGRLGAVFTTPVVAAVPGFFSSLTGVVDLLTEKAKPFGDAFGAQVEAKLSAVGTTITNLVTGKPSELSPLLDKIRTSADGLKRVLSPFGTAWRLVSDAFAPLVPDLSEVLAGLTPVGLTLRTLLPYLAPIAQGVAEFAAAAGTKLADALKDVLPDLASLAATVGQDVATAFAQAGPDIQEAVGALADLALTLLPEVVPALVQLLLAVLPLVPPLTNLALQIIPLLTQALTFLTTPLDENATGLGLVTGAVSLLVQGIGFLLGATLGVIPMVQVLTGLLGDQETRTKTLSDVLTGKFGPALQTIGQYATVFGSVVAAAFEFIKSVAEARFQSVLTIGRTVFNLLPAPVRLALQTIVGIITGGAPAFAGALASLVASGLRSLQGLPGQFASVGSNIISGIISGITGAAGRLASAAANAARSALNAAKAALDINSPSRVFRDQVGLQIGAGIAVGVERSTPMVQASVTAVSDEAVRTARPAFDSAVYGRAVASPAVYVENPFTGEYLLAKTGDVADQRITANARRSGTRLSTGKQRNQ